MQSTMMKVPLSLNHLLERAGHLFPRNTIVSRLPDKSLRTQTYAEYHRRTRALASALALPGVLGPCLAGLVWLGRLARRACRALAGLEIERA